MILSATNIQRPKPIVHDLTGPNLKPTCPGDIYQASPLQENAVWLRGFAGAAIGAGVGLLSGDATATAVAAIGGACVAASVPHKLGAAGSLGGLAVGLAVSNVIGLAPWATAGMTCSFGLAGADLGRKLQMKL